MTSPDQSIETYSYDDKGNDIKSVKDAAGNTTTVTTDAVGNIIADTDGNNNRTEYRQYDQLNRLKAVIDANRQKTTFIVGVILFVIGLIVLLREYFIKESEYNSLR